MAAKGWRLQVMPIVVCAVLMCWASATSSLVAAASLPVSDAARRTTTTAQGTVTAAALSTTQVRAASFAGDGSIVVAVATDVASCTFNFIAWDTTDTTSPPKEFTQSGFCVGAMTWSPKVGKIAVVEHTTGNVALFDAEASTFTESTVANPVATDISDCGGIEGVAVMPACEPSDSADEFVAWTYKCMARISFVAPPQLSSDVFPMFTDGSTLYGANVAPQAQSCADQVVYIPTYLQRFAPCQNCPAFSNHAALLVLNSSLDHVQEVAVPNILEVTSLAINNGSTTVVIHDASSHLQLRLASSIDTVAATVAPTEVLASTDGKGVHSVSISPVTFAEEGIFLWLFSVRDPETLSFSQLVLAVLRVEQPAAAAADGAAAGDGLTVTVQDVRTLDMEHLAGEFEDSVKQRLLGVPLDSPRVMVCFDDANHQAIMAIDFGSDDGGVRVAAGLAVGFQINGTLTPEAPPSEDPPSRFFYKRKWPLAGTLGIIGAVTVLFVGGVVWVARRRRLNGGAGGNAFDHMPLEDGDTTAGTVPLASADGGFGGASGVMADASAPTTASGGGAGMGGGVGVSGGGQHLRGEEGPLGANTASDSPAGSLLDRGGGASAQAPSHFSRPGALLGSSRRDTSDSPLGGEDGGDARYELVDL